MRYQQIQENGELMKPKLARLPWAPGPEVVNSYTAAEETQESLVAHGWL